MVKHRSSTSSSKARKVFRFPWVVAGVLAVLVILEFGVFRQRWFWAAVPRSDVGIYYVLENQYRSSEIKPKIIFMGDSRLREAVHASVIEEYLGLERGEVINLALTAGTPWDALLFIKRNPDILDSAELIVYQPSDWQFNENFPPTNRVRRFATLRGRLLYKNFTIKSELVTGFFLQTVAAREVAKGNIEQTLKNVVKKAMGRYVSEPELIENGTGRIRWRLEELEVGEDTVDVSVDANGFYADYQYSNRTKQDLAELAILVKNSGARFIILDLPVRKSYGKYVKDSFPEFQRIYTDSIQNFVEDNDLVVLGDSETRIQAGIEEQFFYDYGHLTLAGQRLYNIWMAERLDSFLSL